MAYHVGFIPAVNGEAFASKFRKQDKRDGGIALTYRLQELETVRSGHVVIADDAVDVVVYPRERVFGTAHRRHVDRFTQPLEGGRCQRPDVRVVVDTENVDPG